MQQQRSLRGARDQSCGKPQQAHRPCRTRSGRPARVVRASSAAPAAQDRYDYIVVGGGSAGCVLANRLSAGDKRVLVLEAGGSGDSLEIKVPVALTRLFKHPVLDWGLMSRAQQPLGSREVYLARGKTLGGSSCTNATLYTRGSPADYDSWGLDGWKSKDLLDWFMRAENYNEGPAPYHGQGGAMHVEQPRYQNPMHEPFFQACAAAGIPANPDFNNWSRPQEGYGEFQVTQRKGERADMNSMYLKPAMSRGNLKVLTNTRTTKLHIERTSAGPRAVGVEFTQGVSTSGPRTSVQLAPGGEVLLCAGAVHSPHLLQLSGIGPAAHLKEHGVEVVADLPGVGQNLQDHPASLYSASLHQEFDAMAITTEMYTKRSSIRIAPILQYLFTRKGPLATTGCDHGAFLSTTGQGEADLQIRFAPAGALDPDSIVNYLKFGELKKTGKPWPPGFAMQLLAVRPKSKGSVGLRSADPFAAPVLDTGYFTDAGNQDLQTLKAGIKIARNIAQQSPLARLIKNEIYPGPNATSEDDLEAFVRSSACSGNALVGTCKMGHAQDSQAVVDPTSLAVHGVAGLRVVDASVIPRIPGGQTGAATVMVAERAAAMLATGSPMIAPDRASSPGPSRQLVGAV